MNASGNPSRAASQGRILLTIGDPNGVGPEVAVKAVAVLHDEPDLQPVLVGDPLVVRHYAERAGLAVRETDGTDGPLAGAVDLLPVTALNPGAFRPGAVHAAAGAATVAYLGEAVRAVKQGRARGIVGCPHSETAINAAGIAFSGYPSLLAGLSGTEADKVFLLLVGGGLRIVHVTLHEALSHALARLTPELVESAVLAAAGFLRATGVGSPRIGVFGINPHAGEGGLFGDDDARITVPAVRRLRAAGVDADGPVGADVLLGDREGTTRYDAFAAMYHDQGHLPVKLLAGRTAAALSVGAGLAFSSVGHGTAFDIAGRGIADPAAVIQAVRAIGSATVHAPHTPLAEERS
ncbi:4-hydroxythreonine-4-phosphate dehydrogenase PdxA [Streptomyces sp. NPDC096012]|uniref:PdxA family dehydrogenase n=1 Tax=Streptomyces sp. NPDC096012 TaxID=3155684 RepID=UPI00336A8B14